MLRRWTNILPMGLCVWLSRLTGERFRLRDVVVVEVRPGVYAKVED